MCCPCLYLELSTVKIIQLIFLVIALNSCDRIFQKCMAEVIKLKNMDLLTLKPNFALAV